MRQRNEWKRKRIESFAAKQIKEIFLLSPILWEFLVCLHIYSPAKNLVDELKYKVGNNFLCTLLQKSNQ